MKDRLRALRQHSGLTLQRFADALQQGKQELRLAAKGGAALDSSHVSAWETKGKIAPGFDYLCVYAHVTRASLDWIVFGTDKYGVESSEPVYRHQTMRANTFREELTAEMRRRIASNVVRGEFDDIAADSMSGGPDRNNVRRLAREHQPDTDSLLSHMELAGMAHARARVWRLAWETSLAEAQHETDVTAVASLRAAALRQERAATSALLQSGSHARSLIEFGGRIATPRARKQAAGLVAFSDRQRKAARPKRARR